jgi:hypothetical protein
VLLNAIEACARAEGWLVVSEIASPGFVHRILHQRLTRLHRNFDPKTVKRRLSGPNLPLGPLGPAGATWDTLDAHVVEVGLRN